MYRTIILFQYFLTYIRDYPFANNNLFKRPNNQNRHIDEGELADDI